ncbi:MAG: methyltransferase domain-containing protein [Proteobacteria bacterium]|nr:methyltransferase domain-containing protein [Pseudomonadota bacterium]
MKPEIEKFRGYELFAPAMILPAVVNVADFDPERRLEKGQVLDIPDPHHVVRGSIEWLSSQGLLKKIDGCLQASEKGKTLFGLASAIRDYTSQYEGILAALEVLLGWRDGPVPALPKIFENGSRFAIDALIPPAVTFLHECPSRENPKVSAGALLLAGKTRLREILPEALGSREIRIFLSALSKRDLLQFRDDDRLGLTDKGKKVMVLGGFAGLITSYYTAYPHLTEMAKGQLSYGLRGDVFRHAELNARASNGIIEIKVAPKIIELFREDQTLSQTLAECGGIALDFGAGGGEMVQKFLKCENITKAYGMDINPATVKEARRLAARNGIPEERAEFLEGSIVDRDFLEHFKSGLGPGVKPVCTINFILHDVGPKLARRFLKNYREVLGDAPLVITESFRVPLKTMEDHPDQQASLFKFMHDLSGQHLYYKQEFEDILGSEGFETKSQVSHSSMHWAREDKRFKTIVTYVVQARADAQKGAYGDASLCA